METDAVGNNGASCASTQRSQRRRFATPARRGDKKRGAKDGAWGYFGMLQAARISASSCVISPDDPARKSAPNSTERWANNESPLAHGSCHPRLKCAQL
eukprot:4044232-Alexandrium_andersonii.AAC.1